MYTQRIQKLKEMIYNRIPKICTERAVLATEAYQAYQSDPMVIRRAKVLNRILQGMSIYIEEEQLIVGNQASEPKAAPIFPEFAIDWVIEELDSFSKREQEKFLIDEKAKRELRQISKYWRGRTHKDRVISTLPQTTRIAWEIGTIQGEWLLVGGDGHLIVDYPKVLRVGLNGIIDEAKRHLEELDFANPEDLYKRFFLEAVIIACQAAIQFSRRYANLAKEKAKAEKDPQRKAELEKISKICEWVPANPARSFHEALQSLWFIHLIIQIENSGHSVSFGRFDQYMYPFYKKDIEKGVLSKEEALELLECLWVKCCTVNKLRPLKLSRGGYQMYQNLTIGGQTGDARDATNDLSYLCLEAELHTRVEQPSLSARLHPKSPQQYIKKCCEVIKTGIGMPALFNDEVIIPALLNRGISLEDARDYAVVGCVEVGVAGKWGYRCNGASHLNMLKILELALNNGTDPKTGYTLCPGKMDLTRANSFQEIVEAWKEQLKYYTRQHIIFDNLVDISMEENVPNAFCSALVSECIRRGKTIKQGGAIYDITSGQQVGVANVANSLAAIKKLVFEDKLISFAELKKALDSNFEGKNGEIIRQMLINKAPKYGNDDDYVDSLARDVYTHYIEEIKKYKNTRWGRGPQGGGWQPSTATVTANVALGKMIGATPDGRKKGEPTAEGISPSAGSDRFGPTAVIKSVSKLPNLLVSGGQLLNMKFSPSALEDEDKINKFISLIKTFFHLKGWHIQFNVISANTLRDAQKHPEKYKDLVVRVAGYSALFVTLSSDIQEHIIARTEHTI